MPKCGFGFSASSVFAVGCAFVVGADPVSF
jgi:hypothetical protein